MLRTTRGHKTRGYPGANYARRVPQPDRRQVIVGVALLLGASALWSLSGLAVKLADMEPMAFATLRSLGAGLACGLLWPATRGPAPAARWMLPTVLAHALMVGTLIAALTLGTAAEGILLQYTGPLWCALLGWLIFGRRVRPAMGVALALAAAGVAVMLAGADLAGQWHVAALGLTSGLGYGLVILLLGAVEADRPGVNVFAVVTLNNLGSVALLLPAVLLLTDLSTLTPGRVAFVLAVGVVQMAVPYVLFQHGIRRVGPLAASLLVLAEPVLNPLIAWAVAGERPPAAAVAGGGIILLAVAQAALAARPAKLRPAPGR